MGNNRTEAWGYTLLGAGYAEVVTAVVIDEKQLALIGIGLIVAGLRLGRQSEATQERKEALDE